MITPIIDVFAVHKVLIPNFLQFNRPLIKFLRTVAESAASVHHEEYGVAFNDDLVDEFCSTHPEMNQRLIVSTVISIRRKIDAIYTTHPERTTTIFQILINDNDLSIVHTHPTAIKPTFTKINYNVPWGCPTGTILAKNFDVYNLGTIKYVYNDGADEIDIVVGDEIFPIPSGLHQIKEGEVIPVEMEIKSMDTRPKDYTIAESVRSQYQTSELSKLYSLNVCEIYADGIYSDHYIEYVNVHLTRIDPENEERGYHPRIFTINNIEFIIDEDGLYHFSDGELTRMDVVHIENGADIEISDWTYVHVVYAENDSLSDEISIHINGMKLTIRTSGMYHYRTGELTRLHGSEVCKIEKNGRYHNGIAKFLDVRVPEHSSRTFTFNNVLHRVAKTGLYALINDSLIEVVIKDILVNGELDVMDGEYLNVIATKKELSQGELHIWVNSVKLTIRTSGMYKYSSGSLSKVK